MIGGERVPTFNVDVFTTASRKRAGITVENVPDFQTIIPANGDYRMRLELK